MRTRDRSANRVVPSVARVILAAGAFAVAESVAVASGGTSFRPPAFGAPSLGAKSPTGAGIHDVRPGAPAPVTAVPAAGGVIPPRFDLPPLADATRDVSRIIVHVAGAGRGAPKPIFFGAGDPVFGRPGPVDTRPCLTEPPPPPPPPPSVTPPPVSEPVPETPLAGSSIAEAYDTDPGRVGDRLYLDPLLLSDADLRTLERLGIAVRPGTGEEQRASVDGRWINDDTPRTGVARGDASISVSRLRRDTLREVVRLGGLLFDPLDNDQTGTWSSERRDTLRDALEDAWSGYVRSTDGPVDGSGLLVWLREHPAVAPELTVTLERLRELFRHIRFVGLTDHELQTCIVKVLEPIIPSNMGAIDMERCLDLV